MKIAIVGAGISGLACAHELERLGIAAEVFEKRDRVGARFANTELLPQMLQLDPGRDLFDRLQNEYNLPLQPSGIFGRLFIQGPTQSVRLVGDFGYLTLRGDDERSLERQLARHLQSPIHFSADVSPLELAQRFDRVVIATGTRAFVRERGLWRDNLHWWGCGASVKGDFRPDEVRIYLGTEISGTGYGYMSPMDERRATAGVGIPGGTEADIRAYWQRFRAAVPLPLPEQPDFVLPFEVGLPVTLTDGPFLFLGNAAGFQEPMFLGGQHMSLLSGVLGARYLAQGDPSLHHLWKRYRRHYRELLYLRRVANRVTNAHFDGLIRLAKAPGAAWVGTQTPLSPIRLAGGFLRALRIAPDTDPAPGTQPADPTRQEPTLQ